MGPSSPSAGPRATDAASSVGDRRADREREEDLRRAGAGAGGRDAGCVRDHGGLREVLLLHAAPGHDLLYVSRVQPKLSLLPCAPSDSRRGGLITKQRPLA